MGSKEFFLKQNNIFFSVNNLDILLLYIAESWFSIKFYYFSEYILLFFKKTSRNWKKRWSLTQLRCYIIIFDSLTQNYVNDKNVITFLLFLFCSPQTCPFCHTIFTIVSAKVHSRQYHTLNGFFIVEPFSTSSYCKFKHKG